MKRPSPPWCADVDAGQREFSCAAFRRKVPFDDDLSGGCGTGSVITHTILSMKGRSPVFVGGRMLKPRVIEPHTWIECDGFIIDAAATQAGLSSYTARILPIDSPAYGGRTGRSSWYCLAPYDRRPGMAAGPWDHAIEIVRIVAEALERPEAEVVPFVDAALWGPPEKRDAVEHPIALAAVARVHGPALPPEDIRAATKLLRVLAEGGAVEGWGALRDRLLGGAAA